MFFGSKSQPLLGLDITTSSVKLIEISQSGKRFRVESYSAEPTPPSSVNEKAIVDAKAVGEAIRRAVKRSGAKATDVAIAISGDAAAAAGAARRAAPRGRVSIESAWLLAYATGCYPITVYPPITVWCDTSGRDPTPHGMTRHAAAHDTTRHGMMRHGATRHDMARRHDMRRNDET